MRKPNKVVVTFRKTGKKSPFQLMKAYDKEHPELQIESAIFHPTYWIVTYSVIKQLKK